jgi:hypothetical protein
MHVDRFKDNVVTVSVYSQKKCLKLGNLEDFSSCVVPPKADGSRSGGGELHP